MREGVEGQHSGETGKLDLWGTAPGGEPLSGSLSAHPCLALLWALLQRGLENPSYTRSTRLYGPNWTKTLGQADASASQLEGSRQVDEVPRAGSGEDFCLRPSSVLVPFKDSRPLSCGIRASPGHST